MSKNKTSGVVVLSPSLTMGGCERMICHVSFTFGSHANVVFGEGKGERDGVGVSESSESLSWPMVRPRPSPSAIARIETMMMTPTMSLRRKLQAFFFSVGLELNMVAAEQGENKNYGNES